jgi:predicted Zn-dependent peptidase
MTIELRNLENSAQFLLLPRKDRETAVLFAVFNIGSRQEIKEKKGIAHFCEHLFFKGSKKWPTALELSAFIESRGGQFNAFTDKEMLGFYVRVPSKHLEAGFQFLSELIQHPLFLEKDIEVERKVIIEELNMYEDNPSQKIDDLIDQLFYGETSLGWPIIGTKETILSLKKPDFESFFNNFFVAKNLYLAIAGNFQPQQVLEWLEKYFGNFKKGESRSVENIAFQRAPAFLHRKKETEQTHLALGFRGFAFNDPRRLISKLLATLLAGGMSSRLFIEIREKLGLCYYIYARSVNFLDTGQFLIFAGVDNRRLDLAINALLEQLRKIKRGDLKEEECQRTKEMFIGRLLIRLEDLEELASFYLKELIYKQEVKELKETVKEIAAISREDLINLAQEIFDEQKMYLAAIGPRRFNFK